MVFHCLLAWRDRFNSSSTFQCSLHEIILFLLCTWISLSFFLETYSNLSPRYSLFLRFSIAKYVAVQLVLGIDFTFFVVSGIDFMQAQPWQHPDRAKVLLPPHKECLRQFCSLLPLSCNTGTGASPSASSSLLVLVLNPRPGMS